MRLTETDIVERLRNRNAPYGWPELADKAADDIEGLRADYAELRFEFANEASRLLTANAAAEAEIARLRATVAEYRAMHDCDCATIERLRANDRGDQKCS